MASPTVELLSAAELLRALTAGPERGAPLLIAVGGFGSPIDEPCDRLGVFHERGDRLHLRRDLWLRRGERDHLFARLAEAGPLRRAGWDALYATSWRFVWTEDAPDFALWGRRSRLAHLDRAGLWSRRRFICPPGQVTEVQAILSGDWTRHSLVVLAGGRAHELAHKRHLAALLSPVYDGIDLLVDLGWLLDAGRALAAALGAPFRDRTDEV